MKILHTEWSEGWGGQEIRIINEMMAVKEKGIDPYLACKDNAQIKQKALKKGFTVFALPFSGNVDFKTIFALKKIIKQEEIDIVNTHSGKDTWVGGFAAKLAGAKFIRTRHLSNHINPSRTNFINELADFIITTGESVKEDMIKYNRIKPEKIMSIPTGIDEKIFNPNLYDKNKCREKFGIKDEIAIGIVAVLRGFKRHDNFLKIAKRLIENNPDKKFKFLIAGNGPKFKNIQKQIEESKLNDCVVMLGHVDNVAELLMALDIFVLTSDSKEGVPQSIIQALMMNINVIATNAGSTRDLYYNNNFLISDINIDSIYQNVSKLVNNDIKLNKNRGYIIQNFSKAAMVEKLLGVYKKVMDENIIS